VRWGSMSQFYPRVAGLLSKLWDIYTDDRQRDMLITLDRMARAVDDANARLLKLDRLYVFLRSLVAFKDYWGVREGAMEIFKAISDEVVRYVDEELWG